MPTWKSALGRLDPHAWPFSGLAWSSSYSQSDPRSRDARGHGKTRAWAGQRGGADAQGRDPGIMAPAVVPRRNQLRPLGSNQQSSRPLGRLLRGGWTPMRYPFGFRVIEQVQLVEQGQPI